MSLLAAWQAGADSGATRESLRLLDLPPAWVIVLVIVPALAAIAAVGYWRESLPRSGKVILATMRFAALALLALVLCRPVVVERREEVYPAETVLLLDDSASMRRRDAYAGGETGDELRELVGKDPARLYRFELVREALRAGFLDELEGEGYVPRLFSFADVTAPLTSPADLSGRGRATHLGDALSQALAAHRGRHVTDVVLISDGRSNGGLPALDAARAAAGAGLPVHTVVVGDTRPERNVLVERIEVPSSALEGDEIEVVVRVLGRGVQGSERTQVVLEELGIEGGDVTRLVADDEVELSEVGERVTLLAPPATLPSGDSGANERRFRVSVPPLPGETLTDDNELIFSVHVSPQKVRVLYVDGYPRWEYRYLKNLLLRADSNFQVQCFLLSATPDFPQEASEDLPRLVEVPTSAEELLENYDVVILGDVPYSVSQDPEQSARFQSSLREFVEAGGGLLFQSGEFDNPRAYKGTPLEDLLPIVLPSAGVRLADIDTTREWRPVLESPAAPHEIVRLASETDVNRELWESEDGLRGFYWYSPVSRAKPGAQVLLRHPTDRNNHGLFPLLVTGYFPAGRTLFLGVDSTWMWRYHWGDRYHERFWRNAIRWLALGRLKSGDRRFRIESPRSTYDLDERVTLEARVLDEDFKPSQRPVQEALLAGPEGRAEPISLAQVPGREGSYRTAFEVERPGLYRAWIEVEGKRLSSTEFEVVLPSRENADPAPDPALLSSLASMTGGTAVDLANLDELLAEFPGDEERREPISSKLEDAWDRWLTLIVALVLLSIEWVLRKRWELI